MLPQQYCLRWKYHHSNLQTMFSQLLDRGCFCDVTLACEGQLIRAHRVVLCACSTFFDTVLTNYASERDPIIIMKDISFADIKCLIEFMYKGEINVEHANLASLLKTADDLKIKGLAEVTWRDDEDGPPPPTPQTEFYSPTTSRSRDMLPYDHYGHESTATHPQRSHSPNGGEQREQKTPSPKHGTAMNARLPTLTPILSTTATGGGSVVAAVSPNDAYLGPKRKRGRPPLDDSYDVFNVRKMAHYAGDQGDQPPYMEGGCQYAEERSNTQQQQLQHSRPNSPSAAEAYQHHVQQQKQRLRYKPHKGRDNSQPDDDAANEPEWITSSLEAEQATKDLNRHHDLEDEEHTKNLAHDSDALEGGITIKKENPSADSSPENSQQQLQEVRRKNSKDQESQKSPKTEQSDEFLNEDVGAATVPQTVEEMESQHQKNNTNKEKSPASSSNANNNGPNTTSNSPTSSSGSSATNGSSSSSAAHKTSSSSSNNNTNSHSHQHHHSTSNSPSASTSTAVATHHGHHGGGGGVTTAAASAPPPPPPTSAAPPSSLHAHPSLAHHYGKYVPEGYLINEHGILMTHDFIHAPTASIPTSAASTAASNGAHPDEYVDIKMDDYNEADLRLTTEEMSQWQDVIKMDDYLAKGRRPQFWEEPFTRRVLDAIKNKRLEMKKAARILGVSYGTLYGRYREVYGCLKHPYSSTSMRPQSSLMQHRFDMAWPTPKPGQLDIGKLRPKDLSELWTRPQM
ncbi:protein tramtrack, alpha isoform-like [Musca vetustissima]|uniref:protein tramtrack, alpha isoform-like n=1 Tax=Musca vetustissima TaxID=27455 RepID=UPI002AB7DB36|nr:protein tramtrack, alpha isoform-like [Musca vetustissima]